MDIGHTSLHYMTLVLNFILRIIEGVLIKVDIKYLLISSPKSWKKELVIARDI